MVALPLFDVVLSEDEGMERLIKVASELIQSALGDIRHIENLDESLAPVDPSNFDRRTVALLLGMYEDWARSAQGLLDRVARLEKDREPLPAAEALRNAHGRVRAMLSIGLDRLERDHYLAAAPGVPIAEVRRGIRSGTYYPGTRRPASVGNLASGRSTR